MDVWKINSRVTDRPIGGQRRPCVSSKISQWYFWVRSKGHSTRYRFFFSSRRRHTRYWRDWSSDVCSSDLEGVFPSAKVVGGVDFVGDAYDADTPGSVPVPDPNPLDCNGHGTHVAGTAAGYGVNTDGTTFRGDYASLDPFSLRIGPGMAPNAKLYALKVFGCEGTTDATIPAIEWAVDPNGDGSPADHLDVINVSLGSDFGLADTAEAMAVDEAVQAGVLAVLSAGNAGDVYDVGGSPG